MSRMKDALIEIRNRGWPINNESLRILIKEREQSKENKKKPQATHEDFAVYKQEQDE